LMWSERATRSGLRSYPVDARRSTERDNSRGRRERRLSTEEYQRLNYRQQQQRGGKRSRSPGMSSKGELVVRLLFGLCKQI
jgi:hypothetical protein